MYSGDQPAWNVWASCKRKWKWRDWYRTINKWVWHGNSVASFCNSCPRWAIPFSWTHGKPSISVEYRQDCSYGSVSRSIIWCLQQGLDEYQKAIGSIGTREHVVTDTFEKGTLLFLSRLLRSASFQGTAGMLASSFSTPAVEHNLRTIATVLEPIFSEKFCVVYLQHAGRSEMGILSTWGLTSTEFSHTASSRLRRISYQSVEIFRHKPFHTETNAINFEDHQSLVRRLLASFRQFEF